MFISGCKVDSILKTINLLQFFLLCVLKHLQRLNVRSLAVMAVIELTLAAMV